MDNGDFITSCKVFRVKNTNTMLARVCLFNQFFIRNIKVYKTNDTMYIELPSHNGSEVIEFLSDEVRDEIYSRIQEEANKI